MFTIRSSYALGVALTVCYYITKQSNEWLVVDDTALTVCGRRKLFCYAMHALIAVACLVMIAGVLWKFERVFLANIKRLLLGKKQ
mmetsp:Transcript_19146/g.30439  ORF Transcript_19146/g.30439 Transcript_19146/m.30439 type:complete len:85 (+) Transcript_19146:1-255(+)